MTSRHQCSLSLCSWSIWYNRRAWSFPPGVPWQRIAAPSVQNKLKCTEAVGKQILMEVANGAAVTNFPNIHKQGLAFLTTLSTESRLLRWLACSQLHAEYLQLRRSSRNHWPEANIFAVWWNAAEELHSPGNAFCDSTTRFRRTHFLSF